MPVSLLDFSDCYFLWRVITQYDVTWKIKREIKFLMYSEERKLTFGQGVEGCVQGASSEKAVTGENKYSRRVIVWGKHKNAGKFTIL